MWTMLSSILHLSVILIAGLHTDYRFKRISTGKLEEQQITWCNLGHAQAQANPSEGRAMNPRQIKV